MIESYEGNTPIISPQTFIHELACVRGSVEISESCIVLQGASIAGDYGEIFIGARTIIEDNCVIHVGTFEDWRQGLKSKLKIGNNVVVGHGAVIHGRSIGDKTLVGINATILENVEVGIGCVIAAGAVVPQKMIVPDYSIVAGVPGRIKGKVKIDGTGWTSPIKVKDSFFTETILKLRVSKVV
ncbi:gamma carbonic anhydrase family protein [Thermodesulfobacteriota bacterium]